MTARCVSCHRQRQPRAHGTDWIEFAAVYGSQVTVGAAIRALPATQASASFGRVLSESTASDNVAPAVADSSDGVSDPGAVSIARATSRSLLQSGGSGVDLSLVIENSALYIRSPVSVSGSMLASANVTVAGSSYMHAGLSVGTSCSF